MWISLLHPPLPHAVSTTTWISHYYTIYIENGYQGVSDIKDQNKNFLQMGGLHCGYRWINEYVSISILIENSDAMMGSV